MTAPYYPDRTTRRLITAAIVTATLMSSLDSTIANVALPHMQGSVSASSDEITRVLTSYIVVTAIAIAVSGWLAERFGRKRVILFSIVAFAAASALCGLAMLPFILPMRPPKKRDADAPPVHME